MWGAPEIGVGSADVEVFQGSVAEGCRDLLRPVSQILGGGLDEGPNSPKHVSEEADVLSLRLPPEDRFWFPSKALGRELVNRGSCCHFLHWMPSSETHREIPWLLGESRWYVVAL